ncbi:MAG: choice-of-anchor L domain-containing protein [Bacteroidales bacterium]|nr:choice-of-anchor L domain-containing protein [Bacteroidales bacterium]
MIKKKAMMSRLLIISLVLLISSTVFGGFAGAKLLPPPAPVNDSPCGATSLNPITSACNFQIFTTVDATNSSVPNPTCGNYSGGDVWFTATVPASGVITFDTGDAGGLEYTSLAIYTGPNCNTLTELRCENGTWWSTGDAFPATEVFASDGLAGQTVWVRVWYEDDPMYGGFQSGEFSICAYETPPEPFNDNPCDAIHLDVNTNCVQQVFNMEAATWSGVDNPSCHTPYPWIDFLGDMWFTVVVPDDGYFIIEGLPIEVNSNCGLTVYAADDCNNITLADEVGCEIGSNIMPYVHIFEIQELAGQLVYVRFWWLNSMTPHGDFGLCAYIPEQIIEIQNSENLYSPEELAQDVLFPGCVEVSNVEFTGNPAAVGYFEHGDVFGLSSGVILSTLGVEDFSGHPVANDWFGLNYTGTPIEQDLVQMGNYVWSLTAPINPSWGITQVVDVAILEFDFVPNSDTFELKYVFANTGYENMVFWGIYDQSPYSDMCAMFLSGPGISGPYTDNAINIAVVPDLPIEVPIAVTTINDRPDNLLLGTYPDIANYFVPNMWWGGTNVPNINAEGWTVPMKAIATGLEPCQTYHVKLVIADMTCDYQPSYLLIEGNPFEAEALQLVNYDSQGNETNTSFEGCDNYLVYFRDTSENFGDTLVVYLTNSGSLDVSTDLSGFPDSIVLLPYQATDTIWYSVIYDGISETSEELILGSNVSCMCGTGVSSSFTLTFLDNEAIVGDITPPQSVCEGESLTIEVSVNPEIPEDVLSFEWSTSDTTSSISVSPLVTTTYEVTVTGVCGIQEVLSTTISITNPFAPEFSVSNDSVCLGEGVIFTYIGSSSTTGVNLSWTFSDGEPSNSNLINPGEIVWNATGAHNVNLQIDNDGCLSDTSFTVFVASVPEVNISIDSVLCHGESNGAIVLTPSGSLIPYTYLWDDNSTTSSLTNLSAGNYSVSVYNNLMCMSVFEITVHEPPVLQANFATNDVSCFAMNDGSISVSVTGGSPDYDYTWQGISINSSEVTGLTANSYSVTIIDANGCEIDIQTEIFEPEEIILQVEALDVSCFGSENGSITAEVISGGVSPFTYTWSNDYVETGNSSTIENLPSGAYSVSVSDANGCTNEGTAVISDNSTQMIISSTVTSLTCYADSTGSIDIEVTGGMPVYSYLWSNGLQYQDMNGLNAGSYTVTITDANSCTTTESFVVNQPNQLFLNLPQAVNACIGDTIALTASGTGGTYPYYYQWNFGPSGNPIIISPANSDYYTVSITDSNGCTASPAGIYVNLYDSLYIDILVSDDTICFGESVTLNASFGGGNGGPYSIYYNNELINFPYEFTPNESLEIVLSIEDNCNTPIVYDSENILVLGNPTCSFMADITKGCEPLEVNFTALPGNENVDLLWNFGDPGSFDTDWIANPIHVYNYPGVYDVSLTITDDYGCSSIFEISNYIEVYPLPVAEFISQPGVATMLNPQIFFQNTSINNDLNFWQFGDGNSSESESPLHTYSFPGSYEVQLITISQHGCKDSTSTLVMVDDISSFYAPTAFTPNNDGINDRFFVVGTGISKNDFLMIIYDRWGEKIFESNSIEIGWDGKNRFGKTVPNDVYTWLVVYRDVNTILHERAGAITLIK